MLARRFAALALTTAALLGTLTVTSAAHADTTSPLSVDVTYSEQNGQPQVTITANGEDGPVQVMGKQAPSTTYGILRTGTMSGGVGRWTTRPTGNLSVYVQRPDQPETKTNPITIAVASRVSLQSIPAGQRTYRFDGTVTAARAGRKVVTLTAFDTVRNTTVNLGRFPTDTRGYYRVSRTLPDGFTGHIVATTPATTVNALTGTSPNASAAA